MTPTLTTSQLDALSDEDFLALFPGGEAVRGLIVALGQNACGGEIVQVVDVAPEKEAVS